MRAGISKPGGFAIALAIVLLIVVSAVVFTEGGTGASTAISTTASSSPSSPFSATNSSTSNSTGGVATGSCGLGSQLIALNATEFCADDVTNDTVLGGPGYSYFLNGSITFMGVTFQTYCPSEYRGCPGANSTAGIVMLSIMRFTMTFPDKTNETDGSAAITDGTYVPILSSHSNPRAGMLIEITYGPQETTDHVFLLVAGRAVATVTVTATLTTQASQATTTYAIPTTNCTLLPGEIITTTIRVGPTPPASTTTTTVTTTSTSYTQTVTVTSCTEVGNGTTVTSTVTTTVNP